MNPILSHFRAGSGAVLVETREESRFLRTLLNDLPQTSPVCTVAAPSGALRDARTGRIEKESGGLAAGYSWCADGPGRVLLVYDWHTLCNAAGQRRRGMNDNDAHAYGLRNPWRPELWMEEDKAARAAV